MCPITSKLLSSSRSKPVDTRSARKGDRVEVQLAGTSTPCRWRVIRFTLSTTTSTITVCGRVDLLPDVQHSRHGYVYMVVQSCNVVQLNTLEAKVGLAVTNFKAVQASHILAIIRQLACCYNNVFTHLSLAMLMLVVWPVQTLSCIRSIYCCIREKV